MNKQERWSTEEIEKLIRLVQDMPDLYDQSKPGHSNIRVIDCSWLAISKAIGTKDAKTCKAKWQILRGTYRTKRKDFKAPSGSVAKPQKKNGFFYALSFLDVHISSRKSTTNISQETEPPDEEHGEQYYILSPETGLLQLETESLVEEPDEMADNISEISTSTPRSIQEEPKKRKNLSGVDQSFKDYLDRKKPKSFVKLFLDSLEDDMSKLSPRNLRLLKIEIMTLVNSYLERDGKDN